jgi:hypothetical protein
VTGRDILGSCREADLIGQQANLHGFMAFDYTPPKCAQVVAEIKRRIEQGEYHWPVATGSSYNRAVLDLGHWRFGWAGWRAWQDSNLRPAA